MLALLELEVLAGNECPHGKTARDPLGEGDDIGLHLRVLHGKPLTGTAHAGLHLIHDHEGAAPVAHLAYPFEETVRRDDDAGLALDGLDNNAGGIVINDFAESVHVPVIDKGLDHSERFKRLTDRRLVRHSKRTYGTPVEPVGKRDELLLTGPDAGELERPVR